MTGKVESLPRGVEPISSVAEVANASARGRGPGFNHNLIVRVTRIRAVGELANPAQGREFPSGHSTANGIGKSTGTHSGAPEKTGAKRRLPGKLANLWNQRK